jgi:hypothetical protein
MPFKTSEALSKKKFSVAYIFVSGPERRSLWMDC